MTRTDVMASSRPRTPDAARKTRRKLVSLPILLVMGLALLAPGSALAAEETSNYNQTPTTPTTTHDDDAGHDADDRHLAGIG